MKITRHNVLLSFRGAIRWILLLSHPIFPPLSKLAESELVYFPECEKCQLTLCFHATYYWKPLDILNYGFRIAVLPFSHYAWKLIIQPTDQVGGSSLKTMTRLLMISRVTFLQQYVDLVLCHSWLGSCCFWSRKGRAEKPALEWQVGQLLRVHHFSRNRATSKAYRHSRLPRQIHAVW